MKELEKSFIGTGEVRGYEFEQLCSSPFGYIYKKTHVESGVASYEVFRRIENRHFDCVSYPRSKSFGVWAYDCSDLRIAMKHFNSFISRALDNKRKGC